MRQLQEIFVKKKGILTLSGPGGKGGGVPALVLTLENLHAILKKNIGQQDSLI